MQTNKFQILNIEAYYEKLKNGLEIYMIPDLTKNVASVAFATHFGGKDVEFKKINDEKYIKIPTGTAHFLEHKLFESNVSDESVFDFFENRGAFANAYTSYEETVYDFDTSENFEECLNFLLDYVQKPKFTDENVEKEKGIIGQEIDMCQDSVATVIWEAIDKNLFHKDSRKYSIIGEKKEIDTITKEILTTTYNTFYNPKNMFLIITGNFDAKKTIKLITKNQEAKKFPNVEEFKRKNYKELETVAKEFEEREFNVNKNKVAIAFKISRKHIKVSDRVLNKYLYFILSSNFSETTLFVEELKKNNLIEELDFSSTIVGDYIIIDIFMETNKPQEMIEKVKEKVKNLKIDEISFERKKRAAIASYINIFDYPNDLNHFMCNQIIKYKEIKYNEIEILKSMKAQDVKELLEKLDFSNYTVFILNPFVEK